MFNGTLDALGMIMHKVPYFCDKSNDKFFEKRQQIPLPVSYPHHVFSKYYGINISSYLLLFVRAKLLHCGTKLHVLDKPKIGQFIRKAHR
jgi:hypothetical protein